MEKLLIEKYKEANKKSTDISAMINRLTLTMNKRSLVFIFTDFMGFSDLKEFSSSVKHLRHHLHEVVIFNVFHNDLENQFNLQNKYYNVVDMETEKKVKLHPHQIKEKYQLKRASLNEKIKKVTDSTKKSTLFLPILKMVLIQFYWNI